MVRIVTPTCDGGASPAIKANYYKGSICGMISTKHFPAPGVIEIIQLS